MNPLAKIIVVTTFGILLSGCGSSRSSNMNAAPSPTPTPATAEERVNAHFDNLVESMTFIKRHTDAISSYPGDREAVLLSGMVIDAAIQSLELVQPPPDEEFFEQGYIGSVNDAHEFLLSNIQPCRALGARAMLEESLDSLLEAHAACKEIIDIYYEKDPELFE